MDDGVIERFGIEEIYGLHNMPGMKAGTIATRVGGIMASEDNLLIRIKGQERMRRGRIWRKIRWSLRRKSSWLCRQLFREMLIRTCQRSFPVLNCTPMASGNAIPTHVEIKRGYAQLCTGGADAARRNECVPLAKRFVRCTVRRASSAIPMNLRQR